METQNEMTNERIYRLHEIFRRISEERAVIYRCFEDIKTGKFSVQSADIVWNPPNRKEIEQHRLQLLELFIDNDPAERSDLFPSIEAAIMDFDESFSDE